MGSVDKPVAWMLIDEINGDYMLERHPSGNYDWIPLYTHPVKELTELDYAEFLPIWKDFIKDAGSVLNVQMVAHHFYNLALRKAQGD